MSLACASSPATTLDGGAPAPDSAQTDAAPTGLHAWCDHWVRARADWFTRCGEPKRSDARIAELRQREVDLCVALAEAPGNESGGALESCAKSYEAATSCAVEPCVLPVGSRAGEQPCRDDSQCKSAVCNREFGQVCGVCDTTVGEGASCKEYSCDPGLTCEKNVCVPLIEASLGQSCADAICAGYMFCASDKRCAEAPKGEGAPCPGGFCNFGFTCGDDNQCHAYRYVGVGAACGTSAHCETGTCADNAKCVAPAADGAPCGGTKAGCDVGAACSNGACARENPSACK
jgi:hypothetical protein